MPFGADVLVRDPVGAILIEKAQGGRQTLAPAACGAQVIHADPRRGLIVALCGAEADEHGRAPVWIFGSSGAGKQATRDELRNDDTWVQTTDRFVDTEGAGMFDLELQKQGQPPTDPRDVWRLPWSPKGRRQLLRRGDGHSLMADGETDQIAIGPLRWQKR